MNDDSITRIVERAALVLSGSFKNRQNQEDFGGDYMDVFTSLFERARQ